VSEDNVAEVRAEKNLARGACSNLGNDLGTLLLEKAKESDALEDSGSTRARGP
jgi:hypothetical protein